MKFMEECCNSKKVSVLPGKECSMGRSIHDKAHTQPAGNLDTIWRLRVHIS